MSRFVLDGVTSKEDDDRLFFLDGVSIGLTDCTRLLGDSSTSAGLRFRGVTAPGDEYVGPMSSASGSGLSGGADSRCLGTRNGGMGAGATGKVRGPGAGSRRACGVARGWGAGAARCDTCAWEPPARLGE